MLKSYYYLAKPGIIYGNLVTATAGFLLASKNHLDLLLLLETLLGIALVIASACVFNNYIDRDIDKKMARTQKRALVSGLVPVRNALVYASVLGILGFLVLSFSTNLLTVIIGLIGYIDYIVLYGLAKRRSVHGTVVGSVAGAMPIVAGYTAVTNRFDSGAFLLFLILVFWQMPHFYAIAIRRLKDYKAAGLPVLPVKKGVHATKIQILIYILAFSVAVVLLSVFGYTGYIFLAVMGLLCLEWLRRGVQGFGTKDDIAWARSMFLFSLIITLSLSIMISIGGLLP